MKGRATSAAPPRETHFGLRFRGIRIGPGLVLAVLLSAGVWFFTRPDLQARQGPPIVDRAPLPRPGGTRRPARTPEVTELLKHADQLGLTVSQRQALGRLAREWEAESADRRRDMDRAASAFNEFIQSAQKRGREGLGEIQRNAAESSALTSEWLARRAYFWRQGLAELTPEQREKANRLLRRPLPNSGRLRPEARS